jgi:hypothetical protein
MDYKRCCLRKNNYSFLCIGFFVTIAVIIFTVGCSVAREESSLTDQNIVEESAVVLELESSQPEQSVPVQDTETAQKETELEMEEPAPVSDQPETPPIKAEQTIQDMPILKPTLPPGIYAEPFLKSRPIPGQPIIVIYRVWEGGSSEGIAAKQENKTTDETSESDTEAAIKPEPTAVIEPKPVVIEEPVFEPEEEIIVVEEIINPEGSPSVDIISPDAGSFYTKKIQIEGKVGNSLEDPDSVSEIGTVIWEIEGKKDPEELFFGSDGVFFLSFSAVEYTGTINVIIKSDNKDGLTSVHKLTMFDGNVSPALTLNSPIEGSSYGAAIRLSGTVTDPSAKDLNLKGPASLEYSLFPVDNSLGSEQVSGSIQVNRDGSFSEIISSNDLTGEQLVTMTVHGRNGKTLESSLSIVESKSDIPGFFADQEDSSVKLSWESLPGIESYNLFYSDAGVDPAGTNGNKFDNVESPVLIKNFTEGFLYRFQLEAVPLEKENPSGDTYWSDIVETILLTSETLKPVITSGYQQLSLLWLNIPGTEKFSIQKKEHSTGIWETIEQSFSGTSYVDRNVVFGKKYFYQISPDLEGSQFSSEAGAESLPFPEEKTVILSGFGSSNLQDIEVAGSYIFMANGIRGVRIIDNEDPSHPIEIGRYPAEETKGIVIRGERAYIADGYRGIKILDINDPGNPILLGSRKTTDATKLALTGDTVFIADGEAGIKIIDISSERRPSRTGFMTTDFAKDLVIQGSELFVADGPGGFKIVDISSSPNLTLISNLEYDDAAAIAVSNNIVYLADKGFGVRIINSSNSSNPVEIGNIPVDNISDLLLSENYIFISDSRKGLLIYEISDPLRPALFDEVELEGISSLTLNNGVVYLTDETGFKTVRSFTTGISFVIAEYQTDGKAYNLSYIDHNLYLSDHRNGVKIVDVSNPTDSSTFSVTNKLDTTYAESVVGYGSKLLIADGAGGLALGEITYSEDGSQQIEVQESVDLPGITKSLVVFDNTAFIAAREEGMHLLNLETREISTVFTGGSVQEIAVNKEMIYVADGSGGLKIYSNANNAGKPELLATVPFLNAVTVALVDNYVVAGGRDGLSVVDVSTPGEPMIISTFNAGWIEDIYLTSGYIYAAAGYEGLIVLDMKKPNDLVLVSTCEDVYAVGVEVEEDLAFIADVDGFKVVKILIPSWLQ